VTFECIVSADLFRRAQLARSTEETRYYLNGVSVEPAPDGGAILVATDGRRLLALRDPDAHCVGNGIVCLTRDTTKALSAKILRLPGWNGPLTGAGDQRRFVAVKGQRVAVIETRLPKSAPIDTDALLAMVDDPGALIGAYQWSHSVIDGKFPDWRSVVQAGPDFTKNVSAPFNADYLAPIAKALTKGMLPTIRCFPTKDGDDMSPLYVFPANDRIDGFGVLMPVRGHTDYAMPEWAVRKDAVAKAKEPA
jgi:DNA polymerase III beta subunit, central domain